MKTNKFFNLIVLAAIVVMTISCCKTESDGIRPPTSAEFKAMRIAALQNITQTKTFKAEDGIDFISPGGTRFFIDHNKLPVTGDVKLEFIELYKRGEMLAVNKPLMGTDNYGNKGPMITGGQFYVNITKDGEQIDNAPYGLYEMTVPKANTAAPEDPMMTFWIGEEDDNGNMEWKEDNQERGWVEGREGNNYNLMGCHFGWINIDILWNLPGTKTEIWVKVPDGYDNENCSVYLVYLDQPGLAYMDVWDTDKKMFTEHYGLAPIGYQFYVVFVSTYENRYIYAIKDVVIEEGKIITIEQSDLKIVNLEGLIALINSLN